VSDSSPLICPTCGARNEPDSNFCDQCSEVLQAPFVDAPPVHPQSSFPDGDLPIEPITEAFGKGFRLAGRSSLALVVTLVAYLLGSVVLLSILDHVDAPPQTIAILVRTKQLKTLPADEQQANRNWFHQHWQPLIGYLGLAAIAYCWFMAGQLGYLAARAQEDEPGGFALFARRANALFIPYLMGMFLLVSCALVCIGILMVIGLIASGLKLLPMLIVVPGLGVMLWGLVKISPWGASLALDGGGLLHAFDRSLAFTEGRWWKTGSLYLAVPAAWNTLFLMLRLPLSNFSPLALLLSTGFGSLTSTYLSNALLVAYYKESRGDVE